MLLFFFLTKTNSSRGWRRALRVARSSRLVLSRRPDAPWLRPLPHPLPHSSRKEREKKRKNPLNSHIDKFLSPPSATRLCVAPTTSHLVYGATWKNKATNKMKEGKKERKKWSGPHALSDWRRDGWYIGGSCAPQNNVYGFCLYCWMRQRRRQMSSSTQTPQKKRKRERLQICGQWKIAHGSLVWLMATGGCQSWLNWHGYGRCGGSIAPRRQDEGNTQQQQQQLTDV